MKRISYQNGSVSRVPRSKGTDVWVFRYRDAAGIQKASQLGTLEKYPTKAAAKKQASKLLKEINDRMSCITISGLCDRYALEGMPARKSTAGPYRAYLKRFRADWGTWRLDDMAKDVMAVEQWVNGFCTLGTPDRIVKGELIKGKPSRPASKKTKKLMKAFIHRVFELAIKWGYLSMQRNPVGLVEIRGRNKRTRPLILLSGEQYRKLISDSELPPHVIVMITVAMLLGLRASEILGLRWEDVDFEKRVILVRRSVVNQFVDETKTPESEADLPLHEELALVLTTWRDSGESVNGWLFGNVLTGRPFWRGMLQQDHLAPAGIRAGIDNLGWHAFRHTYRAMLGDLDVPLEMQKTLMRHSDITTTLSYGGKPSVAKSRSANAQVIEMIRRSA